MIRSGTLLTLPAIAAFVVGGVVLCGVAVVAMRTTAVSTAAPIALEELGKRVLVIAPHPDDEVIATGGTIHRLVAAGVGVKVVLVTAGDSYLRAAARIAEGSPSATSYLQLGDIRHRESLAAAVRLGLRATDVVSLGYSDGTTQAMWDASWDESTPARGRTEATRVPYAWAARPDAPICGQRLAADLESVISDFAPDTVIAPDPYETNADHAMTAAFATYAMDAVGYAGRRLSSVVHFRHYPYPWAHLPGTALNPPPQLLSPDTTWLALPLDAADKEAKATAIAEYGSQTAIADLGLYMRAFIRTNELFASRAPARLLVRNDDSRPSRDESATIAATPAPVVPIPVGSTRPRINAIRMARGPRTLWIGLRCDASVTSTGTFTVGLRLFGGEAPARLDISVRGTEATTTAEASNSIAPEGVRAEVDGDTLWVAVPVDALAGRTRCMVGASVERTGGSPMRAAWREVDL
jgi:LmbE family N-acetylglucosaminyl deacetylase